jgi:hypothetical protein
MRNQRRLDAVLLTMRFAKLCGSTLLLVVLTAGCSNSDKTQVHANGGDASSTAAGSEIEFQGIVFALPAEWTTDKPFCGQPSDKTVVVGRWGSSCPAGMSPPRPASWVRLDSVVGPQSVSSFSGEQLKWHGQTAWLFEEAASGMTMLRLTVPRLNAVIEATAPQAADAHALLEQARTRPMDGLGVPSTAPAIFIEEVGGTDGDGLEHNATITSPDEVRGLLDDLRNAELVDAATPVCDGSWYQHTALLTVHRDEPPERTFAVRLDKACGQVTSDTGHAGVVSGELRADILRLVPNPQLIT